MVGIIDQRTEMDVFIIKISVFLHKKQDKQ